MKLPPIIIRTKKEIHFCDPHDILRIETASSVSRKKDRKLISGEGNYTYVFLNSGPILCVRRQIAEWERLFHKNESTLNELFLDLINHIL